MNPVVAQQISLDNALVTPEDRVKIGKCNMRIDPTKTQKEVTYLFWFTISKIKDTSSYQFKLDKKKCKIGVEVFREVLQICPRLPNQGFVEPPSHEEIVSFIKEIGYKGDLESITELVTDHMYQPWRTFMAIINGCLSGKATSLDKIILSIAQILETSAKRQENMPYPRFIKAIIQYFISKDKSISMRNRMFMHSIKNDSVLGTLKFVPKGEDYQVYGKKIPDKNTSLTADDNIISDDLDVALELAKSINRTKAKVQEAARLVHETHERLVTEKSTGKRKPIGIIIKDTPAVSKKKTPVQAQKHKGMEMLSEAASLEEAQTRKALKISR
ncbi:hypothetical protein Tco_0768724 [Tanacetum coccineum]